MPLTPAGSQIDNPSSGSSGGVSSFSGDGNIITNNDSTGAVTATIAGTSGGVPYFSSSATWASSGVLAAGHVLLGGGAGSAPTSDAKLDDGITTANTLTYTGTAGIVAPIFNATSAAKGFQINGTSFLFEPNGDSSSLAIGYNAFAAEYIGTANANVGIGPYTLYWISNGSNNTAVGYQALTNTVSDYGNSAMGGESLYNCNGGNYNTAIGFQALTGLTTGSENLAIGTDAGYSPVALTTGRNCTFIGYSAVPSGAADTNETVIGAAATGAGSNTTVIGNSSTTDTYFGSSSSDSNIHGAVYYSGGTAGVTQTAEAVGTLATKGGIVTTFTAVSDERLKIWTPYEGGLPEILKIVPIRYRWNEKGQELSGQSGNRDYVGFSAQNTQASIPETIQSITSDGYLSFEDRPVIAALVNAVKELAITNSALVSRLARLEKILDKGGD